MGPKKRLFNPGEIKTSLGIKKELNLVRQYGFEFPAQGRYGLSNPETPLAGSPSAAAGGPPKGGESAG